MSPSRGPHPVDAYLDLVESRSPREATRLALGQLDAGYRPEEVILGLLAPAQRETGRRWQVGRWNVAHEHQATAVTDAALHELSSSCPPGVAGRGHLTVVCAEGDWHTLPARMAAEILRLDGWDVTFLGGSLPARDLARWLAAARPDGLVVSCALPTFARGVLSIASAARQVGVRVVAGGRGLGVDSRRAASLGVGWAPDLTGVSSALSEGAPPVDHRDLQDRVDADVAVQLDRQGIVDSAMARLALGRSPTAAPAAAQLARTAEDLGHILDFAGAAALTGDARVFADFLDWLRALLTARGVPLDALQLGLRALSVAVPPDLATIADLLGEATGSSAPTASTAGAGASASGASTLPVQRPRPAESAPVRRPEVLDPGPPSTADVRPDLRRVLERDELRLHYQPIVSVTDARVVGFEALLRWQHGDRLIPPVEFLPIADELGLSTQIGAWVRLEACHQAVAFARHAEREVGVSVNVSPTEVMQPGLVAQIRHTLGSCGLSPSLLTIEITETAILNETAATVAVLQELSSLGARLSLDDFGTGFSSLSHLRHLGVNEVKIDRSFVEDLCSTVSPDRTIVAGVAALAHALGLSVTAEGAETRDQVVALKDLGVDLVQGYWFSRPVAAQQALDLLVAPPPGWSAALAGPVVGPVRSSAG